MRFGLSKPRPSRGAEGAPTAACPDHCVGSHPGKDHQDCERIVLLLNRWTRPQSWIIIDSDEGEAKLVQPESDMHVHVSLKSATIQTYRMAAKRNRWNVVWYPEPSSRCSLSQLI